MVYCNFLDDYPGAVPLDHLDQNSMSLKRLMAPLLPQWSGPLSAFQLLPQVLERGVHKTPLDL